MRSTLKASVLITTAAVAAIAGCKSADSSKPAPASAQSHAVDPALLQGEWILQEIDGKAVASLLPAGARAPDITIGPDGSLNGYGGVNRIGGKLDAALLPSGGFKLGPVRSTMMAGPEQSMNLEAQFTHALSTADGYAVRKNELTVTQDGRPLLQFTRK